MWPAVLKRARGLISQRNHTMPLVLEFGSRGGSWFALAFFSLICGTLGWAIAREIRKRARGELTTLGRVLGFVLSVALIALVYASMASGFYQLELNGATIQMRYLFPGIVSEIPVAQATARIAPAYRGRVRMIVTAGDRNYQSTPWHRDRVNQSLSRLNAAMRAAGPAAGHPE
jgi:hypothetical protein